VTWWGIVKVYILNVIWMLGALLGFIGLLLGWASRGFGGSIQAESFFVERFLAKMCIFACICNNVIIQGEDNLPLISDDQPAPIYVANHGSQLDLAVVYFPLRTFKWIAKKSVQFLPGVGNIMFLSHHVFIQRSGNNSKSVSNLYSQCCKAIREEHIPVMIFPQGTRSIVKKLPFKNGAYNIALETQCDIVPVSIYIPPGIYNSGYPFNSLWGGRQIFNITVTIHKAMNVQKGMDKEKLKKQSINIIYSALPSVYDKRSRLVFYEDKKGNKEK